MNLSLIDIAVKGLLVVAVAAVATGFMRRRASAASRHLVWTLAVEGLLVLPIASIALPSLNIPIARQLPIISVAQPPAAQTTAEAVFDGATYAASPAQGPAVPSTAWIALLPLAYAAGVIFLLG